MQEFLKLLTFMFFFHSAFSTIPIHCIAGTFEGHGALRDGLIDPPILLITAGLEAWKRPLSPLFDYSCGYGPWRPGEWRPLSTHSSAEPLEVPIQQNVPTGIKIIYVFSAFNSNLSPPTNK